jgi:hypothetical protein
MNSRGSGAGVSPELRTRATASWMDGLPGLLWSSGTVTMPHSTWYLVGTSIGHSIGFQSGLLMAGCAVRAGGSEWANVGKVVSRIALRRIRMMTCFMPWLTSGYQYTGAEEYCHHHFWGNIPCFEGDCACLWRAGDGWGIATEGFPKQMGQIVLCPCSLPRTGGLGSGAYATHFEFCVGIADDPRNLSGWCH